MASFGLPSSMSTSVLTTPTALFSPKEVEGFREIKENTNFGKERKDALVRELSMKESKQKQRRRSMAAPRKGRSDMGLPATPPTNRQAPTRTLSATAAEDTADPAAKNIPVVLQKHHWEGGGKAPSAAGTVRAPPTRSRASMVDLFMSSPGGGGSTSTAPDKTPHPKSTHMATTIFGTISRSRKNSVPHKSTLGLFDVENDYSSPQKKPEDEKPSITSSTEKLKLLSRPEEKVQRPLISPRLQPSAARTLSSPPNRARSHSTPKSPRTSFSGNFSKRFLTPKKTLDDAHLKLKITGVRDEFDLGTPRSGSLSARPILEHSQPKHLETDYDSKRHPQTARPRTSIPEFPNRKGNQSDLVEDSKVPIFRVYLLEGRFTLQWDKIQGRTLLEVLEEIRQIIQFDMEGKIPRNRENSKLNLNTLVSELGTWEIFFGVSFLNQLNDTELNPEGPSTYPKLSCEEAPPYPTSPIPTKQMEHEIMKEMSAKGTLLLDVMFPKNNPGEHTLMASSKVIWAGNKTLREVLSHPLTLRQMKIEDLVPKDSTGNRLDWSKNLSELYLKDNKVVLVTTQEDNKPVKIYLPGGQVKEVNWDPTKELQQVLQALVEARPELQNKEYKLLNASNNQPYLDLSIKLQDIGEPREICFGTTYKEWIEQQRILNIHMKKVQRKTKRSSLRTRSTSKTKLPKVIIDDPPTKKLAGLPIVPVMPEAIYIYLPDGSIKTHPFEKNKELELGQLLDKLGFNRPELKDTLANAEPLDQIGRPLDRRTKLKDLGTIEVAFGITLEAWTLKERADDIQKCLKQFGEVPENFLKVYLPQGTTSSVNNNDPKRLLGDVLRMLCVKRADLVGAVPKDVLGNVLDPKKTLGDINIKEICYGVTILEWLEHRDKEKNKNKEDPDEDISLRTPRVKQRFGFLFDSKQESPSLPTKDPTVKGKESARGTGDRKKDKTRSFSGSRSPHNKNRQYRSSYREANPPSYYFSNYTLPTRPTVDEIQHASQLQSYWHMQNAHLSDDQLYRHYLEEEPKYQMTHMVPYRFLDVPATFGRSWEWEGNEGEENDVEKGEGDIGEKNFVEKEEGEQSMVEFLDWMRNMEQAVAARREESQSGVVSVV